MNRFEYTLQIDKIRKAKTKKALYDIIEDTFVKSKALLGDYSYYSPSITSETLHQFILIYKCFTLAASLYDGSKAIPKYIRDYMISAEDQILTVSLKDSKFTYSDFCDAFEFTEQITAKSDNFFLLNKLIADNELPLTVKNTIWSRQFFSAYFTEGGFYYNKLSLLYQIEYEKSKLDPSISYTLLEDLLSLLRSDTQTIIANSKNKITVKDLKTYQATMNDVLTTTLNNLSV